MTPRTKPDTPEIREQLERLLESPPFRTSRRCSDFLRYVVDGSLEGRTDPLRERSIGAAIFKRPLDYDTSQDPIVRNTAGQVRKRLAQYYCEPGRERELRIDIPPGSYVPEAYKPEVVAEPEVVAVRTEERRGEAPLQAGGLPHWAYLLTAAVVVIAGTLLIVRRSADDLDRFWSPLWNQPGPTILCVGQGHTYKLAGDWDRRFEAGPLKPGTAVPLSDVQPAWDRYIGINDAQTATRITALFATRGKPVQLIGGRTASLEDLRRRPVVLIGGFNNEWTLDLTGELRFYFAADSAHNLDLVLDRQHPDQRSWSVRSDLPANQIPTDYAIVTRVHNRTTEQTVVVAAGIKGAGTAAAGEFLTNPSYLNAAFKDAPKDSANKNIQLVLAVRMFNGSPGPATVVAAHYW